MAVVVDGLGVVVFVALSWVSLVAPGVAVTERVEIHVHDVGWSGGKKTAERFTPVPKQSSFCFRFLPGH